MTTDHFNAFWNLDEPWFESPNKHRGGWSGVVKYHDEKFGDVFIKKQENYTKRTWRKPIQGELTVSYEKKNIDLLNSLNIPTLTVDFFEEAKACQKRRGILVTQALNDYMPLDEFVAEVTDIDYSLLRENLIKLLTTLHEHHLAHCALYPKHIFIRKDDYDLRLIDLEKLRYKFLKIFAMLHDLNKLNRHLDHVPTKERLKFLQDYLKTMKFFKAYHWLKRLLLKKFKK